MGAHIVVATPGRLIAHLNMGYVKTNHLKYLILDEADRMLDMGFISDIKKITSFLPKQRQTLMFSATMPQKIRKFANSILNKPETISLAVSKPAEGVLQAAYIVEDELKPKLLENILKKEKTIDKRILIFCTTKANVKKVYSTLRSAGLGVGEIHSDLDQGQREQTLRQFKNGNTPILVATDILSRGIDVKGINLVINYDVPNDPEDYIHRVGRTARADSSGVAMTLVNRKDGRKFKDIERFMEIAVKKLALPPHLQERQDRISSSAKSSRRSGGGRGRGNNSGGRSGGKRKWGGNNRRKKSDSSNNSGGGGQSRNSRPARPKEE
jgi:superfamily II DNA/RNA helicase